MSGRRHGDASTARVPRVHVPRPGSQRPAGADAVRDAAVWAPSAGRPATPRPAAAASISAATVRSCRSTTAASASSRSTSCWPTSAAQVAAGARHITFGDPDFFNGIGHARRGRRSGSPREFPACRYDVTIKVEHLLQHADVLPLLRDTGCVFVTSAVEAVDDRRARAAREGAHARRLRARGRAVPRASGCTLAPTFVAFTPWTTLEGYCDLLQTIDRLDLVEHVAPIQLAIRLLVTEGSRLLELPDVRAVIAAVRPALADLSVGARGSARRRAAEARRSVRRRAACRAPRREIFARVWTLAHDAAGVSAAPTREPPTSRRGRRSRISTNPGTVERSPRRSRWL